MSSILTEEIDKIYNNKDRECNFRDHFTRVLKSDYKYYGVPTIRLHKIAKRLATQLTLEEIMQLKPLDYDELSLLGLIISYYDCTIEEKLVGLDFFFTLNDNWSASDIVCNTIKDSSEVYFNYLLDLFPKGKWQLKYAINAMMFHFMDEAHIDAIFEVLGTVTNTERIIKRAVASFVLEAYQIFPEKTIDFFDTNQLPLTTIREILIKIRDSKRTPQDKKEVLEEAFKDVLCRRGVL